MIHYLLEVKSNILLDFNIMKGNKFMGKNKIIIKNKESFALDDILKEVEKRKERRKLKKGEKNGKDK